MVARRDPIGLSSGRIHLALCDADTDAGCRSGEQVPEKREPPARDGSGDIGRGIPDANREDVDVGWTLEDARAEGQNSLAVGGTALGEDSNDSVRIFGEQVVDLDELGVARGSGAHRRQGHDDGAQQANALDLAGVGV